MTAWTCSECDARNPEGRFCRGCGTPRNLSVSSAHGEPEFVPPWKRPEFTPSRPEDRCPECGQLVREHIEDFKRFGERIVARAVKL